MEAIDFETMTAERFVAQVPFHEDHRFEWKASPTLSNPKFDFELGKQVSAFANSKGGYLILGIKDDRSFDPLVDPTPGRRPTRKDWLVGKVNRCVEFPLNDFKVHPLPLENDRSKAIYVIEIPESLSAPHRAVDEGRYYYRLDGRSDIAPHHHVELLLSRTIKAKLKLTVERRTLQAMPNNKASLQLIVRIENVSLQCAERWGVIIRATNDKGGNFRCKNRPLSDGAYIEHHQRIALMPLHNEKLDFVIDEASDERSPFVAWDRFGIELIPVSQNYAGEPIRIEWRVTDGEQGIEMYRLFNRVTGGGRSEEF